MARPVSDPTLARCEFKLGARSLKDLDLIARESARCTRKPASRADAVRWAVRELAARIELARAAERDGADVMFSAPGPITTP